MIVVCHISEKTKKDRHASHPSPETMLDKSAANGCSYPKKQLLMCRLSADHPSCTPLLRIVAFSARLGRKAGQPQGYHSLWILGEILSSAVAQALCRSIINMPCTSVQYQCGADAQTLECVLHQEVAGAIVRVHSRIFAWWARASQGQFCWLLTLSH